MKRTNPTIYMFLIFSVSLVHRQNLLGQNLPGSKPIGTEPLRAETYWDKTSQGRNLTGHNIIYRRHNISETQHVGDTTYQVRKTIGGQNL
jgi:hypothetical protein